MSRANRVTLPGYVDLNLVRTAAAEHPSPWEIGGYREKGLAAVHREWVE